jgi:hypothetical protein
MRALVTLAIGLGLVGSLFGQTTRPVSAGATVTLKRIVEKREISLEKGPFSGWENGIDLTMHVDGPDVVGARKYGKLQAKRAVDDAGTDLTKKGEGPQHSIDSFDEVREPQQGFRMQRPGQPEPPKPTGFDVELKLPTPPLRSARTINVTGELQVLVGGEKKIISVKPIQQNLGKAVDDAALKSLGVSFALIDPSKPASPSAGGLIARALRGGDTGKSLTVQISGNIPAIASIAIVDSSGKNLNQGAYWSDDKGVRTMTYDLEKPLPADASLQLEVWPGEKAITIPIELKDVKLP